MDFARLRTGALPSEQRGLYWEEKTMNATPKHLLIGITATLLFLSPISALGLPSALAEDDQSDFDETAVLVLPEPVPAPVDTPPIFADPPTPTPIGPGTPDTGFADIEPYAKSPDGCLYLTVTPNYSEMCWPPQEDDHVHFTLVLGLDNTAPGCNGGGKKIWIYKDDEDITSKLTGGDSGKCLNQNGNAINNGLDDALTCDWEYVLTKQDIENGGLNFIFAMSGEQASGHEWDGSVAFDEVTLPLTSVSLTKSVSPSDAVLHAGQEVTYTWIVDNVGDVEIHDITVTETNAFTGTGTPPSSAGCQGSLPPHSEPLICSDTYTLTQEDVDAGFVHNVATVSAHAIPVGQCASYDEVTVSDSDEATLTIRHNAELSLTKTAVDMDIEPRIPGESWIEYLFEVKNTGNMPLKDIHLSDNLIKAPGTLTCDQLPTGWLAPGATLKCSGTYILDTADIVNDRYIINTATASGKTEANSDVVSPPAQERVDLDFAKLTLTKTAHPSQVRDAGTLITYTYQVKNTGHVDVTGISVAEVAFTGRGTPPVVQCDPVEATSLIPGATLTCVAYYEVTQEDLDNPSDGSSIGNWAVAYGTSPDMDQVESNEADARVTLIQDPSIIMEKSADRSVVTRAGMVVNYSFVVWNTGNLTVNGIAIDEISFTGQGHMGTPVCGMNATTLEPGQGFTCRASYTVTQADMDLGADIVNTATAKARSSNGESLVSNQDTAIVAVSQRPALLLEKNADPRVVDSAGQEVTYTFTVTNTGNQTIKDIDITEVSFTGHGDLSEVDCPHSATPLAPGSSTTCTATYVIADEDEADGRDIINRAYATGVYNDSDPVESNHATEMLAWDPALLLTKTADPAIVREAGTIITYTLEVTNISNAPVTNVMVMDYAFTGHGDLPEVECDLDEAQFLAPGASLICTVEYEVTQEDLDYPVNDAGILSNWAFAFASGPSMETVVSNDVQANVTLIWDPELSFTKNVDLKTVSQAGTYVLYSFRIQNTGNLTIQDLSVEEVSFSGLGALYPPSCLANMRSLRPGQFIDCLGSYQITQADMNRGEDIVNIAVAHGSAPDDMPVTSNESSARISINQNPGLTMEKSVSPATVQAAGDQVRYSFQVRNTGNVTVSTLSIVETAFSGGFPPFVMCPATTLVPGSSTTCTSAPYTVRQDDIDAGMITNTAIAQAQFGPDNTVITSLADSAIVTVPANPMLRLSKTTLTQSITAAGQIVTYAFIVENTGNVSVHEITINELGFTGLGVMNTPSCSKTPASLKPSETLTCTATYRVIQPDMNRGFDLVNTAVAVGKDPHGVPVTSNESSATVPITQTGGLALEKTASRQTIGAAGETVFYTFRVTNTGNVSVRTLSVVETDFSGVGQLTLMCPDTSLAPGAAMQCWSAPYTVQQSDIDAGLITNTAKAEGVYGAGAGTAVESDLASAEILAVDQASLRLVKTASVPSVSAAGEKVSYSFEVHNNGNRTVRDLEILETQFSGTGSLVVTCTETTLIPGASTQCTSEDYTVRQSDLDAGEITNTATAVGVYGPADSWVTSAEASAIVTVEQTPMLTLTKTTPTQSVSSAGENVTYTYAIENTGNLTISDLVLKEIQFSGTGTLTPSTCGTIPASLIPGDIFECTTDYTVNQADINKGSDLVNTAIVYGKTPEGLPVASNESTATVEVEHTIGLALEKTVSPQTVSAAGETLTYTFTVTNTSNVTVHTLGIVETEFSGSGPLTVTCPAISLLPGGTMQCSAEPYTVEQSDIDAGILTNTAQATGKYGPLAAVVTSPEDSAIVTVDQSAALTLTKTTPTVSVTSAGEILTYTYTIENTGNLTISDIAIQETDFSGTGILPAPSCGESAATLKPGETLECTTDYIVTRADMNRGAAIVNTAVAVGETLTESVSSNEASVSVGITRSPALSLLKTVSPQTVGSAGEILTYSFAISNTGNVTVQALSIVETAFSGSGPLTLTCPTSWIDPGETITCVSAPYTVQQADMDAGLITNTAQARGTYGTGIEISSVPSSASVLVAESPQVSLDKTTETTVVSAAGETVTYSFTATNTGNVSLSDVKISELCMSGTGEIPVLDNCEAASLEPGGTLGPCTATYTVTPTDMTAGTTITNTAQATGISPRGVQVFGADNAEVDVLQTSSISLEKTVSPTHATKAGESVEYTFTVTNTGHVTLDDVAITETAFTGSDGTALNMAQCSTLPDLAPGSSATCKASYTLTQEDIDAGILVNTARVEATAYDPGGTRVSDDSTATVRITHVPSLSLIKTATPTTVTQTSAIVDYTFVVVNTGNVTVTNIEIDELQFTGTGSAPVLSCDGSSLVPGANLRCTASYTVTLADMDSSLSIVNQAQARGDGPGSLVTSNVARADVEVEPSPSISLTKVVETLSSTGVVHFAGEELTYTHTVTNTGNVTLHGLDRLTMTRGVRTATPNAPVVTCPLTTLAPHESMDCTAVHITTQDDIESGSISHRSRIIGTTQYGESVRDTAMLTTPVLQAPSLNLAKTAVPSTLVVGETIEYQFLVTNDGNMTVAALSIEETVFSASSDSSTWPVPVCPEEDLAPGDSALCTATWVVTQADIDEGHLDNTAIAHGYSQDIARTYLSSPEATVILYGRDGPALSLTKSGVLSTAGDYPVAGDTITYTFTASDSGAQTLTQLWIYDPLIEADEITCDGSTLAPNQEVECVGTYTLTQTDIDRGFVHNYAIAHAMSPSGDDVASGVAEVEIGLDQVSSLSLVKSADKTQAKVGDSILYSFLVTNTGSTSISSIVINETSFTGTGKLSAILCPLTSLAPQGTMTCTATYIVSPGDLQKGKLVNTAIATGNDPRDEEIFSDPSTSGPILIVNPIIHVPTGGNSEPEPSSAATKIWMALMKPGRRQGAQTGRNFPESPLQDPH